METAERICKRFHSYLLSGEYTGRIAAVTGEKLDIETAFGIVSIVNAGALQPFSCFVSGIQPFTAMNLQPGMDVLLDRKSIDIPDGDLSVDVTLAEDVDLSIECMVNLFLPVDISIRARYIHRIVEQYSANEDLSLLIIDPESAPELQQLPCLCAGPGAGDGARHHPGCSRRRCIQHQRKRDRRPAAGGGGRRGRGPVPAASEPLFRHPLHVLVRLGQSDG